VLSPDASLIATVGRNGVTNVWDAATGERRAAVPTGSTGSIWRDVAFSPDASLMVARGPERLAVFDVPSESLLHTLIDTHEEGHERLAWWAIGPEGDTVWAVVDQEVRSWSMRSGEAGRRIDLPPDAVDPMLVFDESGRLLAVDRSIRPDEPTAVWDVERGEAAYTLPAAQTTLAHTDLPIAVTGSMADGSFAVHDLASGAPLGSVTVPPGQMAVAFSDDGRWLVSVARQDRAILITSVADGDTVVAIPEAGAQVEANRRPLAVSARAGVIAYAERASQYPMTIWDVRTGALVRALELESPYSARAISESGLVMMVDRRGGGALVDARSGEAVAQLGRGAFVDALFDASGTRLATLDAEGVVSIHDVETGEVVAVVSLPEVAGP
jgi:WD40 repeat protein